MPNRKVTDFTELVNISNLGSFLHIIDIDAVVEDRNKRISITNLINSIPFPPAGEPFVEINSDENTGTLPTATGVNSIAIGESSSSTNFQTIAIGTNSIASGFSSMAIGASGTSSSSSIVIGDGALIGTGAVGAISIGSISQVSSNVAEGIAIGRNARANSVGATVVGGDADASGDNSVAIGNGASVQNAANAGQIGQGNNLTASTLQFLSNRIAMDQGVYAGYAPSYYFTGGSTFLDDHLEAIDNDLEYLDTYNAVGLLSNPGELVTYDGDLEETVAFPPGTNGQVLIANSAITTGLEWVNFNTGEFFIEINSDESVNGPGAPFPVGTDSIAIGGAASADSVDSLSIGFAAEANNDRSVAIGYNTTASADGAIVIGTRTDGPATIGSGLKSLVIGTSASTAAPSAVVLGPDAFAGGEGGIAIGDAASAGDPGGTLPNGVGAIAIGDGATARATGSVQVGAGTNFGSNTFRFQSVLIADSESIKMPVTAGVPSQVWSTGALAVDSTNNQLYFRSSGAWNRASNLINESITSGTDVTLTPGTSSDRVFISPTTTINLILSTTGATNSTYFLIVNVDPGAGDINIKIDSAANPTVLTLNAGTNNVNAAYDGTDYKLWG